MKVYGLADCLLMINGAAQKHPQKVKQQVKVSGRAILNKAKLNLKAKVYDVASSSKYKLTGDLLKSGFVEYPTDTNAKITFDMDYAPYIEFGTGGLVDVPNGWEDFAMQFKGAGIKQVNLKAKPYLIPALLDEYQNFVNEVEKILET